MTLAVVTASTNPVRALPCLTSWGAQPLVVVANGCSPLSSTDSPAHMTWLTYDDYLGCVPAFRSGVDFVLDRTQADIIGCLHDDLEILDPEWAIRVERLFQRQPEVGLVGFGGAIGLGDADLYQKPYAPQQLARIGFRSNLIDAEVHGVRSLLSERVACLDGFSLIGRRDFFLGIHNPETRPGPEARPWTVLEELGIVHHLYDGLLGALADRYGWHTWYLPIRCRHYGGQTAVGDSGYQEWAKMKNGIGDQGFWEEAHRIGYEHFRDVLPLRV